MRMLLDIDKLKECASLAGIPLARVCAKAGVKPATISRMRGDKGRVRTLTKLNLALAECLRERREALAKIEKEVA